MEQLQSILTDLDNKAITKHQAYDLILVLFDVSKNDWLLGKAVYLRNVCSKICGDFDFSNHRVYREWRYLLDEKCKGNDTGILSWVNRDIKTPLINKFLLHNGFHDGEPIIYYISW